VKRPISVFLDCNVILDLLAVRRPFYQVAAKVFMEIQKGGLEAYTSPIIFGTLFYLLSKEHGEKKALEHLRKLRALLQVVTVTEVTVDESLNSDFADFEDALQYHAAKAEGIQFLVTRNVKDYKRANKVEVITPEEFLVALQKSKEL